MKKEIKTTEIYGFRVYGKKKKCQWQCGNCKKVIFHRKVIYAVNYCPICGSIVTGITAYIDKYVPYGPIGSEGQWPKYVKSFTD